MTPEEIETAVAAAETDIPLTSALQELARRIEPFGLKQSEALNWVLTIPGLDQFFAEIVEHKKRIMQ